MRLRHRDAVALRQRRQMQPTAVRLEQGGDLQGVVDEPGRFESIRGEEGEIETDVLSHDRRVAYERFHVQADAVKARRRLHVLRADSRELLNTQGDLDLGVHKRAVGIGDAVPA